MEYDVIIIGSGIGGLTCASLLSAQKKKVLLLEKNKQPGGCMEPIRDDKDWSIGVQYVCKYGEKSIYNTLLKLVTDNGVKFSKLNPEFQLVDFYKEPKNTNKFGKKEFSFPIIADTKLMRERLIKTYPDEKRNIKKYYRLINRINRGILSLPLAKFFPFEFAKFIYPIILRMTFPFLSIIYYPLDKISIKEVIEKKLKIKNQEVRDIIYSYYHFTGMTVDSSPFLFWAIAQKMVEGGVYFPNGGGRSIVNAYMNTINKNGGTVECFKEVKNILIENNTATGVELIDGTKIHSKIVISATGIAETIKYLIPKDKWNEQVKKIRNIVFQRTPSSNSEIILRVGLEGDISKFNIKKATYRYIVGDSSQLKGDPTKENWLPPDLIYSFFSIYDDSNTDKNYTCVDILQPIKYSYFKDIKYPSEEYNKVVANITKIILEKFDERFPGITKLVTYTNITTPISFKEKTAHIKGSIFGRSIKKAGYAIIQPRSGIKNLFYSGQDIFSPGITVFNGLFTSIVVGGLFKTLRTMFKKWKQIKRSDKNKIK